MSKEVRLVVAYVPCERGERAEGFFVMNKLEQGLWSGFSSFPNLVYWTGVWNMIS